MSDEPPPPDPPTPPPDPEPEPAPEPKPEPKPKPEPDAPEDDTGGSDQSIAAQVIGNVSLLGAVLIYMGWNYENSALLYFHIPSPFSIGIGTVQFALKGVVPLFTSGALFFAALVVAVVVVAARTSLPKWAGDRLGKLPGPADQLLILGVLLTVVAVVLAWTHLSGGSFTGWFYHHQGGIYLVFGLLAAGQVMAAWPLRKAPLGPFVYPLALIVAGMFTLWAGGIYAANLGNAAGANIQHSLSRQTAVTVYSAQSLNLSGPGVTCAKTGSDTGYPFQCAGLRLLYFQSGTYYLVPDLWNQQHGHTYILDDSNQIRIELSAG
jgi:hypothetical protein